MEYPTYRMVMMMVIVTVMVTVMMVMVPSCRRCGDVHTNVIYRLIET
jgi:hypothetical protein